MASVLVCTGGGEPAYSTNQSFVYALRSLGHDVLVCQAKSKVGPNRSAFFQRFIKGTLNIPSILYSILERFISNDRFFSPLNQRFCYAIVD